MHQNRLFLCNMAEENYHIQIMLKDEVDNIFVISVSYNMFWGSLSMYILYIFFFMTSSLISQKLKSE